MLHAAFDELQIRNLTVDDGELLSQRRKGGIERVAFQMCLDLLEGKADLFHHADRVQIVELRGAIIAIAVLGVYIGGAEKTDLIVKDESLTGNILMFGELADRKQFVHKKPLDLIVTI